MKAAIGTICLIVCLLLGCGSAEKVDIVLTNNTDETITIRAEAGPLKIPITLAPGKTWKGHIFVVKVKEITVTIEKKKD